MTSMAASGIGKLFGLVKSKPPKPPRKDYEDNSDEGDTYEYQDPSKIHSTLPPPNTGTQEIPNYPPPRPHHSPQFPRLDQDKRASAPVLSPPELPGFPQGRTRPQRPQSSEHSKYLQENSAKTPSSGDDYQDPWDTKTQGGPVSDYSDPWDSTRQSHRLSKGKEDYSDPWDSRRPTPVPRPRSGESREKDGAASISRDKSGGSVDDYCDPWDSKKQEKLKGKDDYTDPWDAKKPVPKSSSSTESQEKDSDDDSYSEPYDAGKITVLDEQARRMSLKGMRQSSSGAKDNIYDEVYDLEVKKPKAKATKQLSGGNDEVFHEEVTKKKVQSPTLDDRPLDDYDSPWETKKPIPAFRSNKKATLQEKRSSAQQPNYDSRQADDYDRPWEWTKKCGGGNASTPPAHSKSTDSSQTPKIDTRPADEYEAPWEFISRRSAHIASKMQEHATAGQPSCPPKPPRAFTGEEDKHKDELEELFDPSLPLDQQGWYHGPISRMEAENLLRESEDCSYLVRNSESSKKDYSLSVRNNETFMHLKIQCNWEGKYILGQFSKPFDTLPEMIYFYTVNKLNIRGAEHKKLRRPVVPSNFYHVLEKTHL